MSEISRRSFVATAISALAAPLALGTFASRAWAATPNYTLKLAFADTTNHPVYGVLRRFADNVRAKTNGAVDVQVFSIGQLGSGANIMTGLQTGIIDLCAHTSGFIDTTFPQFQVVDLPFLFPDARTAEKVLDGTAGSKLLDLMPQKGIYGLGFGHWGWRVVSTVDRKVPRPGDMHGMKVRVQPGAIFASTFRALGASPTAIDLTEVYLALSQGVVDAVETPMISVAATKQDEVVKIINQTNHVYNAGVLMASKSRFDTLPANVQGAIRAASREMTADWRNTVAVKSTEAQQAMQKKGLEVVQIDRNQYLSATSSVYQQFRPVVGAALFDAVMKEAGHA
ncbi:TRAP transporter substrate-binding protein [Caballeronia grimmiae]|uniref:ABC transporter substrate-binding protein n=1 Tax=Caballeronia grimmiae TaxID=1071679 RepID=A0A069NDB0_9BURK|nr:TRAP transporter substrate-binding protein [Caballeronia grimmiae]KDR25634.1 TRAP dicarboxylate transporter subunit DctP [Caballeronia grimmiae]GGD98060.1 ABC transporter substrate-binding protein [Caballeronia grimmiae]